MRVVLGEKALHWLKHGIIKLDIIRHYCIVLYLWWYHGKLVIQSLVFYKFCQILNAPIPEDCKTEEKKRQTKLVSQWF